jgi:L-rhamnose isomerase/sugar isomerase
MAYAQALLIDRKALEKAQEVNDAAQAQEILQHAFRTDVRPLLAEARLRTGAALQPLPLFREEKIRKMLINERGMKALATGL